MVRLKDLPDYEDAQVKFMSKISGGIKLALAQYHELAAFSQFASDLDDATRRQLEQGERINERMKQNQYAPMTENIQPGFESLSGMLD